MTDPTLNDLIEEMETTENIVSALGKSKFFYESTDKSIISKGFIVNVPRGTQEPKLPLAISARDWGCIHISDARGLPVWDVSVLEKHGWGEIADWILGHFEGFEA